MVLQEPTKGGEAMRTSTLKDIARIRLMFDPGEKRIEELIRHNGPRRALEILSLAADFSRTIGTVH